MGRFSAIFCAALLAACATARLEPPKVGVEKVSVDYFTAADSQFTVIVSLHNPNDREIAVDGIEAQLRIENVPVGTARLSTPVRLPAGGDTTASMVAHADLVASLEASAQIARRLASRGDAPPTVRYAVSGAATLDGGTVVPFSRSGEFGLSITAPTR
ncbi:MAG TPA: LEA type 2 family protein [Casimicrobiaceae bacterium]|nr:LEA type 2 family protein [Casimicrobiaceae bacterium]